MTRKLLFAVLFIGILLRILWLDKYPAGFTPDEASFGYDAYSILKTGKDQWGNSFPLVLKSFGDYKTPLQSYLTIPFVAILGLSRVSVRLPNVILGIAAIYVTYILTVQLGELMGFTRKKAETLGIISSFLLAISPWHIMMGRGGFEANLTIFFLPLGMYMFIRGVQNNNSKFFILSSLILGLNLFSYHSARFVTPVVVAVLVYLFKDKLVNNLRSVMLAAFIFLVFVLATVYSFSLGAGTRATQISIFNGASNDSAQPRLNAIEKGMPPFVAKLFHNKFQIIGDKFFTNYFQYFSPQFMFTNGPSETTYGMIPGRGVIYWFELPFLLAFLLFLFTTKNKFKYILLIWLLSSPVPASLTLGPGYAGNRAVIAVPALQISLALGALALYEILKGLYSEKIFKSLSYVFVLFSAVIFLAFLEDYFIQSPRISEKGMSWGNLEAAKWLHDNTGDTQMIIVSNKISEPHIYIAFAYKWDPVSYQAAINQWKMEETGVKWIDQIPVYTLGNFTFKNIDWNTDSRKNSLLVGREEEFPENVVTLKVIKYPDGNASVLIVDPQAQTYAWKNI